MTTQPLTAERTQLSQTLHPNDRVQIVTKRGQHLKFKVEKIDENGLHGAGQNVAYDDIEAISLEKISAGRTALVALGIAAAASGSRWRRRWQWRKRRLLRHFGDRAGRITMSSTQNLQATLRAATTGKSITVCAMLLM